MKHLFKVIALVLLVLIILPANVFAADMPEETEDIIYFDDGSYLVTEILSMDSRALSSKSGSKTSTYYSSTGDEQWSAVLSAVFTYNGAASYCTSCSLDITVTNSAWYVVSQEESREGNTATGELTMGKKFLGITIEKKPLTMTLTCDANGNLS